jgi:hypothetical protein
MASSAYGVGAILESRGFLGLLRNSANNALNTSNSKERGYDQYLHRPLMQQMLNIGLLR